MRYVYRDGKLIPKHLAKPLVASKRVIIKDIEPYQNVVDRGTVGGRRQHRELLRNHNLIEVGDQAQKELPKQENKVDLGLVSEIKRAMGKL